MHLQTSPVSWCPGIPHPATMLLSAAAQPKPLTCAPAASWSLYGTCWPHVRSAVLPFKGLGFFSFLFPSLLSCLLPLLQLILIFAIRHTFPLLQLRWSRSCCPFTWLLLQSGCSIGKQSLSGRWEQKKAPPHLGGFAKTYIYSLNSFLLLNPP